MGTKVQPGAKTLRGWQNKVGKGRREQLCMGGDGVGSTATVTGAC